MNKPLTLVALAALLLASVLPAPSCTFTTTIPKTPVYGEPIDSLRAQVRRLVTCEHFDVEGQAISTNGKQRSELRITIINGKGIPEGSERWDLARTLAGTVKRALKDTTEYGTYVISFQHEEQSSGFTSKSTTSREFLSRDL